MLMDFQDKRFRIAETVKCYSCGKEIYAEYVYSRVYPNHEKVFHQCCKKCEKINARDRKAQGYIDSKRRPLWKRLLGLR